ncbi:MAG: hypothetical protein GAK28_00113 [Luteibacter sp.]|uniref:baseplate J/gp47 family protein n=1 Tax=Luteibacter sp. TaxID=1886636 RepID=UPI00138254CF|nr:baseplate J/gp47 family protein [Luteibacter sp.]KAF1009475.1 MAG: hypothetical protein GAK28_00113 [Luteibacter sp.]
MASVNSKSFSQLVTDFAVSVQARASALVDFTVGSILRATAESQASVVIWLEGLILLLLATTRAATSNGPDLDSWMADFQFFRLQAATATGQVVFARFTPGMQAVVPIGAVVQTADGTLRYSVVVDATNAAYSAQLGGYVILPAAASMSVPVVAASAGAAYNVVAGAISVLAQAVPYVDTVTNLVPITNGADAEQDGAFRARFVAYIASLSRATKQAILNAITSLKIGATASLAENQDYNGNYHPGYFYAVVDDGSGVPGSTFLASAYNAIDAVRPFTVAFGVFAPITTLANVAMAAAVGSGYDPVATKVAIRAAIQAYIAGLSLGQGLSWSRLLQVAYDASPGITNITGLTVNGGTTDIVVSGQQRIIVGTVTVS